MSNKSSAKTPILISLALVVVGIVLSVTGASIIGGVVAGLGVIPAAWGAWAGMQQETQASLAGAIGMVFLSLGVGAVLIVLGLFDKVF
jgi:hypothetical protein